MADAGRRITLIGMVNPPTGRYAAGWSHPAARRDWLQAGFYVDTARALEDGGFDMVFLPDTLAVPEDAAGEVSTTLETGGKGAIQLDPLLVLAAAAGATSRIGLGATVSTGFLPPYHLARSLLTLDHLSRGRGAWNIVTSTARAEARNMGLADIPAPAVRYDRADDVVAEVLDLMDTWADDALVLDPDRGVFADPARVRRARRGSAPGPLTLPRSPQGRPVLMQAGSSDRGRDFAARWAEVVFVAADGPAATAALRTDIRERARRIGRDPDGIRVCAAIQPVVGATRDEAVRTLAGLRDALDTATAMRALGRLLHAEERELVADASAVVLLDAHRGATGSAGFEEMLRAVCVAEDLTVGEFALRQALNQLTPQPFGSGTEVADELCDWVDSGAADGFVVMSAVHPLSVEQFVREVCPVLAARGRLLPSDEGAEGLTLRGRLGLS